MSDAEPARDPRVFVVLGAAVWEGGVPSHALRRRVEHAVRVAGRGEESILLLTGGVGRHPPSEARVMAAVARDAGFPGSRIWLEETATSTDESARRCAALLRGRVVERVTLVTDAYHVERSLFAFRRAGVEADAEAPPDSRGTPRQRRRERWAFRLYRTRAWWRSGGRP